MFKFLIDKWNIANTILSICTSRTAKGNKQKIESTSQKLMYRQHVCSRDTILHETCGFTYLYIQIINKTNKQKLDINVKCLTSLIRHEMFITKIYVKTCNVGKIKMLDKDCVEGNNKSCIGWLADKRRIEWHDQREVKGEVWLLKVSLTSYDIFN